MTLRETWVRFAAGVLADNTASVDDAAKCADKMVLLMLERWPHKGPPEEVPEQIRSANDRGKTPAV